MIDVKYYGTIADLAKKDREIIKAKNITLSDLISLINKKYSGFGRRIIKDDDISENYRVLVDGEIVKLDEKLKNNSTIVFLPMISGG